MDENVIAKNNASEDIQECENNDINEIWENFNKAIDNEHIEPKNCRFCQKIMSDMRKTSIRWIYTEWYKKAVLSLNLPSISDLKPNLAEILKEKYQLKECGNCTNNIEELIRNTLQPINRLNEMYSSLQKNSKLNDALHVGNQTNMDMIEESLERDNITLAASFFIRAAQRLHLRSSKRERKKKENDKEENRYLFVTNFSELIMQNPPQPPPSLFKHGVTRKGDGPGKVRMLLKVTNRKDRPETCLSIDSKKKQISLTEHSVTNSPLPRRFGKEPMTFTFDGIYDTTASSSEISAGALVDLIQTVVNGNDACLLTYGYPKLGKTAMMIGKDDSVDNIGVIPNAISWLYQLIDDRRQRTGARFSVRVSAVEIVGKSENLKDLLGEQGNGSISSNATSPSVYLPRERASTIQLSDFTELRAPNPCKAAFYFDAAVNARFRSQFIPIDAIAEDEEERKNSSMIFTLHVYQYMIDKVGTGEIHGGRSRFHLIDLSGCSRKKRSRDTGQGSWLTLSALGYVIASLANGTKHIPHRDSKLTTLLREAMGPISSRITIIASVSQDPKHSSETLSTFQQMSRIHRSRKKKNKMYSSTSSSGGESSSDERRKHRRKCKPVAPLFKTEACQSDNIGESDFTSTSAAEESCDTVIYRGPNGGAISDRELTDFEHPPPIFEERPLANHKPQELKIARVAPYNISKSNENSSSKQRNKTENPIDARLESNSLKKTPSLERKANYVLSPKKYPLADNSNNSLKMTPSLERKANYVLSPKKSSLVDDSNTKELNMKNCKLKEKPVSNKQNNSIDTMSKHSNNSKNVLCRTFSEKTYSQSCSSPIKTRKDYNSKMQNEYYNKKNKSPRIPRSRNNSICSLKIQDDNYETDIINKKIKSPRIPRSRNNSISSLKIQDGFYETDIINKKIKSPNITKSRNNSICSLKIQDDKYETDIINKKIKSPSIPRSRNNSICSLKIQDDNYETDFTTFHPEKTISDYNSTQGIAIPNYPQYVPNDGSQSLDRALLKKTKTNELNNEHRTVTSCLSTDTVSSSGTVDNFERDLVSQIAERFALEDEFEYTANEKTEENDEHPFTQSQDFFIDDDLESITKGLQCISPIDLLNPSDSSKDHEDQRLSLVEESEQRPNYIISCNNCIGQCHCNNNNNNNNNNFLSNVQKVRGCDSGDDTDEKTNNELQLQSIKNRQIYSSCESQLDCSPKAIKHRPSSEGVSSGYESMRCESSANINLSDGDRCKKEPRQKTIYEISDEFEFIGEAEIKNEKGAQYRQQIQELLEKRQDLKEELHLTLKKLVLSKTPLPDIDERLRTISLQSKDPKVILTRENRILERKLRVCKSHLQLVASMQSPRRRRNTSPPSNNNNQRNICQRISDKIKAKFTRNSSIRKSYKVTSV